MAIKESDIKIDIIKAKFNDKPFNTSRFIKIEHLPSGITATASIVFSQVYTKKMIMEDLEEMVNYWEEK